MNKLLCVILLLLVGIAFPLFVFTGCTGCSDYDNVISQKQIQSASNSKIFEVNEPVVFGDLEYVVLGFEESKEYNGHETENKFVIVTVSVKNQGKEPVTITNDYFVLIDGDDRIYDSDPTRDISFHDNNYFSLTESINPGLTKKGRVSFEVPEDVNTYMLGIKDNMFDFGGAEYRYVVLKK